MGSFFRNSCFSLMLMLVLPAFALPPLQLYVALTPEGGELKPPPGRYSGPVVIDRRITLDGGGEVILDAEGRGTVLTVRADGSVIRGMHITGSGDSHDKLDAGVLVEADGTLVEGNVLRDVLFGIHLKAANGNIVRGNEIRSAGPSISLRGDAIRLWNSHENRIEGNDIAEARDLVVSNSRDNRFLDNRIRDSRIGLEMVFSPDNLFRGNHIVNNLTGILLLHSDRVRLQDNRIQNLREQAGYAVSVKQSSQVRIENNEILHCVTGLAANAPLFPENILHLIGNRFAYNDVALYFYGEKGGHRIIGNRFEENMSDVMVSIATTAVDNIWRGNYWDTYEGLDLNDDGIGDVPHELHLYADRIWMDRPATRFFRASPMLEVIDFMERLAPLSTPKMVLRDAEPLVR